MRETLDEDEEAEDEREGFQWEDLADAMLDMFEDADKRHLNWLPPALEAK